MAEEKGGGAAGGGAAGGGLGLMGTAGPSRFMRELVQRRLLQEVVHAASESSRRWMVLVLDDAATRIISAALGMYDVMEAKVTLVEQISKRRQPFPQMEAIYFVAPTSNVISRILDDFRDADSALYAEVHLFFLAPLPEDLFGRLRANRLLCNRMKTLKEVNLDFLAVEASAFHLDMPHCVPRLFGQRAEDDLVVNEVVRKLRTLCITLNEFPIIRFQDSSTFARHIASRLHGDLQSFLQTSREWWYHGHGTRTERDRATLLIVDRADDPLTPLMHQFHYQSMVYDFLDVREQVIKYTADTNAGPTEKEVLLNDNDELWVEFRHEHIQRVSSTLGERMDDFVTHSAGAALAKRGADLDTEQMSRAVKELPQYREVVGKLSQHVKLASQCMSQFTEHNLLDLLSLEQELATGEDELGQTVRRTQLVEKVEQWLRDPIMTVDMKVRLLTIFIITQQGITADERHQLVAAADLSSEDQQTLLNFERLGVSMQQEQQRSSAATALSSLNIFNRKKSQQQKADAAAAAAAAAATGDSDIQESRHVPRLRILGEQIIAGSLSQVDYPTAGGAARADAGAEAGSKQAARSVRRHGANSRWAKQEQGFTGGRLIVFVVGGISYAELQTMYNMMEHHDREVVAGGTSFLSPKEYVNDVRHMDDDPRRMRGRSVGPGPGAAEPAPRETYVSEAEPRAISIDIA